MVQDAENPEFGKRTINIDIFMIGSRYFVSYRRNSEKQVVPLDRGDRDLLGARLGRGGVSRGKELDGIK